MADVRTRMLVGGGVVMLAGVVILLVGLRYAAAGQGQADQHMSVAGLTTVFVGAVMFAVGGMVTLVAIVRPLFEKRSVDHHVERRPRS